MDIEEIEKSLPNGFHDASLRKIEIDFVKKEAKFHLAVDVSDCDAIPLKEEYRDGILTLMGLVYCVVEPPSSSSVELNEALWIADSGPISSIEPAVKLPAIPAKAFAYYFFVNNWNAFIYVAAIDATFEWDI